MLLACDSTVLAPHCKLLMWGICCLLCADAQVQPKRQLSSVSLGLACRRGGWWCGGSSNSSLGSISAVQEDQAQERSCDSGGADTPICPSTDIICAMRCVHCVNTA